MKLTTLIMKKQRPTKLILLSILVLASVFTVGSSISGQTNNPNEVVPPLQDQTTEGDRGMARQRHQLMEDMRAQDVELTKAVAKMNDAPKDKKMALMAAIITQMVEQRADMNSRMQEMQEQVMHYMIAMKGVNDKSGVNPKEQK